MIDYHQKNVNISKAKDCFNFLKNHFQYYTANPWNGSKSIANNVKIYNLGLEGDCWKALERLEEGPDMEGINCMIESWEEDHPGYEIGFNGRSNGYLVLYNKQEHWFNVIPDYIDDYATYNDWKEALHEEGETVKYYKYELRFMVELVRDFDKLCNQLVRYVNNVSKIDED